MYLSRGRSNTFTDLTLLLAAAMNLIHVVSVASLVIIHGFILCLVRLA